MKPLSIESPTSTSGGDGGKNVVGIVTRRAAGIRSGGTTAENFDYDGDDNGRVGVTVGVQQREHVPLRDDEDGVIDEEELEHGLVGAPPLSSGGGGDTGGSNTSGGGMRHQRRRPMDWFLILMVSSLFLAGIAAFSLVSYGSIHRVHSSSHQNNDDQEENNNNEHKDVVSNALKNGAGAATVAPGAMTEPEPLNEEEENSLIRRSTSAADEEVPVDEEEEEEYQEEVTESLEVAATSTEEEHVVTAQGEQGQEEEGQVVETVGPEDQLSIQPHQRSKKNLCNDFGQNDFCVMDVMDHDTSSFTQGLTYHDGVLYESAGLYKQSKIRKLDPDTGDVLLSEPMDNEYFAEGMTYHPPSGTLVMFTWREKAGFVYDTNTLRVLRQFTYDTKTTEGWGLTYMDDTGELVASDGSSYLHFWNGDTPGFFHMNNPEKPSRFEETRRVRVTYRNGAPVEKLNELEYVNGYILANIWYKDDIVAINPRTGVVEKVFNMEPIWPRSERWKSRGSDVLNGISVSDTPGVLYITGKKWPKIYTVVLKDL